MSKKIKKGKGMLAQISVSKPIKFLKTSNPSITFNDFKNAIESICNNSDKSKKMYMQISGTELMSLSDEQFKLFFSSDNVVCYIVSKDYKAIQERAKKLGVYKEIEMVLPLPKFKT